MKLIVGVLSLLIAAQPTRAAAQEKVLLENEYVRVVQSGQATSTNPPKSYEMTGGKLKITFGDSSTILVEPKKIVDQAVPLADDPFANNPKTLKVLLENESVRVMEAAIPPAWKEKQHSHPGYVTYILKGGTVRMHFPDGTSREVPFNTGEAKFTAPVTHWAENIGADTVKIVLVELRHK